MGVEKEEAHKDIRVNGITGFPNRLILIDYKAIPVAQIRFMEFFYPIGDPPKTCIIYFYFLNCF